MHKPTNHTPGVCYLFYCDVSDVKLDVLIGPARKFVQLEDGKTWKRIPHTSRLQVVSKPNNTGQTTELTFRIAGHDEYFAQVLQFLNGQYLIAYKENFDDDWQLLGSKHAGVKLSFDEYRNNQTDKAYEYKISYTGVAPCYMQGSLMPRLCSYSIDTDLEVYEDRRTLKIYIYDPVYDLDTEKVGLRYIYFGVGNSIYMLYDEQDLINQRPNRIQIKSKLLDSLNFPSMTTATDEGEYIQIVHNFTPGTNGAASYRFWVLAGDGLVNDPIILGGTTNNYSNPISEYEIEDDFVPDDYESNMPWHYDEAYTALFRSGSRFFQVLINNVWEDYTKLYQNSLLFDQTTDTITFWRVVDQNNNVIDSGTVDALCLIK